MAAQTYLIPGQWIWMTFILIGLLFSSIILLFSMLISERRRDYIIMMDGDRGFRVLRPKLKNMDKYVEDKKTYPLIRDAERINRRGKKLYIFDENDPRGAKIEPINLKSNPVKWLDAGTLTATINNEVLKLMFKLKDMKDMIILICCILSGIGAVTGIFIALKVFGVLKG